MRTASTSAANLSIAPIVAPLVLVGIGFALSVSAVTVSRGDRRGRVEPGRR